MTNWRERCAELLQALETEGYAHWTVTPDKDELCLRTRAELAQPEPQEPTDEELISPIMWMIDECVYDNDKGEIAQSLRELITRFGHPAAPPAPEPGEVAGLVAALRDPCISPLLRERTRAADLLQQQQHLLGLACAELDAFMEQQAASLNRAEQRTAQPEPKGGGSIHGLGGEIVATIRAYASVEPQVGASRILHESDFGVVARAILARWGRPAIEPVPVSERLPGEGDCDSDGRCWWGDAGCDEFVPSWRLCEQPDNPRLTHWCPYLALPVPTSQEITNA
jgi:hypothetical protein